MKKYWLKLWYLHHGKRNRYLITIISLLFTSSLILLWYPLLHSFQEIWNQLANLAASHSGTLFVDLVSMTSLLGLFAYLFHMIQKIKKLIPKPLNHQYFQVGTWKPYVDLLTYELYTVDKQTGKIIGTGADHLHTTFGHSHFQLTDQAIQLKDKIVSFYRGNHPLPPNEPQSRDPFPFNSKVARLEELKFVQNGEKKIHILKVSAVDYYDFLTSNLAWESRFPKLDQMPPEQRSLPLLTDPKLRNAWREATKNWKVEFTSFEDVLKTDYLANGITIHLNVIDSNRNLIVGIRSDAMAIYQNTLISTISGAVQWEKHILDPSLPPTPFMTAIKKGKSETGIDIPIDKIKFYALVMQKNQYHPILIGDVEINTPYSNTDSLKQIDDAMENNQFIPLPIDNLKLCAAVVREGNWLPASAAAVVLSLMARHPIDKVIHLMELTDSKSKLRYELWRHDNHRLSGKKKLLADWVSEPRWSTNQSEVNVLRFACWDPYEKSWETEKIFISHKNQKAEYPLNQEQQNWLKRLQHWQNELLSDGEIAGLHSIRNLGQDLFIQTKATSFFPFLAYHLSNSKAFAEEWKLQQENTHPSEQLTINPKCPNGISIHLFITDPEGKLLLSKRPPRSLLYANHYSASIACTIDEADVLQNDKHPLIFTLLREIKEELGEKALTFFNEKNFHWLALVTQSDQWQPIFWAHYIINSPIEELIKMITKEPNEVLEIYIEKLASPQLMEFLENHEVIPTSKAGILFLQQQYGHINKDKKGFNYFK